MAHDPILQRVYQETDVFGLGDKVVETQAWGVDMLANSAGYELITSVVKSDRYKSYGALAITVKVDDGIFGNNSPRAVEISPTVRPDTMVAQIDSTEVDANGGEMVRSRTYKPPKREHLFLPGDKGFTVFEELQAEMKQLSSSVTSVMDMMKISEGTAFGMSHQSNSGRMMPDGSMRYHRMDYFSIGTPQTHPEYPHMLELNMNTEGPRGGKRPEFLLYTDGNLHRADRVNPKPYWREGSVVYFDRPTKELDFDELMAFSALGSLIQDLAPKNPYM